MKQMIRQRNKRHLKNVSNYTIDSAFQNPASTIGDTVEDNYTINNE